LNENKTRSYKSQPERIKEEGEMIDSVYVSAVGYFIIVPIYAFFPLFSNLFQKSVVVGGTKKKRKRSGERQATNI